MILYDDLGHIPSCRVGGCGFVSTTVARAESCPDREWTYRGMIEVRAEVVDSANEWLTVLCHEQAMPNNGAPPRSRA